MSLSFLIFILFIVAIGFLAAKQSQINKLKEYIKKIEDELGKKHKYESRLIKDLSRLDPAPLASSLLDSLTQLPGREAFEDRLTQALSQTKRNKIPLAVMLIDIGEFNAINKEYGHEVADKLLIEVSNRLRKTIRQVDTASRYVSDKFAILLPLLSKPETAAYVAQRIQDTMIPVFHINDKDIQVYVRIGISVSQQDGEDKETLLQHAETALQRAKQEGSSSYHFYQQDIQILSKRELSLRKLFRDLRYLEHLVINYQPYIRINKNEIECIQVIPYFEHSELGLVRLSEFEKMAENAGKLIEVSEAVLVQSMQQFKKWNLEKFTANKLLVSLYLKQIEKIENVEKIIQIIHQENIDPKTIIFLLGEDVLSVEQSMLEKAFYLLDKEGIQMAMGVFTLGHFSLKKIGILPFKYLKIDGRLVQGVNQQQNSESILSMLIDIAKSSHIEVLGEGVENSKQKLLLMQLGCEVMQGRLFCRPLPAESLEKMKLVS